MTKLKDVVLLLVAFILATLAVSVSKYTKSRSTITPENAVVMVLQQVSPTYSGGTGVVIKLPQYTNKVILTNKHVCMVSRTGFMHIKIGDSHFSAQPILKMSVNKDLCLINAPDSLNDYLVLSDDWEINTPVSTLGYPYLQPLKQSDGVLVKLVEEEMVFPVDDVIQCMNFNGEYFEKAMMTPYGIQVMSLCKVKQSVLWTNMTGNHGSSGSPIINPNNEVVALVSLLDTQSMALGAVSLEDIKAFIEE